MKHEVRKLVEEGGLLDFKRDLLAAWPAVVVPSMLRPILWHRRFYTGSKRLARFPASSSLTEQGAGAGFPLSPVARAAP